MTALNKQAQQVRHWSRMASMTSERVSCVSVEQLDEIANALEAAEKRIAELSHHLQCAHAFIEHTEAFGYEASNGILCCGDAQWNIDASKSALASTGSINGED